MSTEQPPSTSPPAYTEKEDEAAQEFQPQPTAPQPLPPAYGYPAQFPGGAVMPIQYIVPAAEKPPAFPSPPNYFTLAMVTTIIFGLLNIFSLTFGIPAIVFSVMSMNAKKNGNYPKAKNYGTRTLILIICNTLATLMVTLLIIGLTTAIPFRNRTMCTSIEFSRYSQKWRCYYY